jgi:hypothetical protein
VLLVPVLPVLAVLPCDGGDVVEDVAVEPVDPVAPVVPCVGGGVDVDAGGEVVPVCGLPVTGSRGVPGVVPPPLPGCGSARSWYHHQELVWPPVPPVAVLPVAPEEVGGFDVWAPVAPVAPVEPVWVGAAGEGWPEPDEPVEPDPVEPDPVDPDEPDPVEPDPVEPESPAPEGGELDDVAPSADVAPALEALGCSATLAGPLMCVVEPAAGLAPLSPPG